MKGAIEQIVGKKYVSDAREELSRYASDHSLVPPAMPDLVVRPKNSQEVSQVVAWANENNIPIVPVSSQEHFHGCTIPKQGGIILDLGRMNKVLEIDLDNRRVRIEPGVTWKIVTEKLAAKGMRMIMPLLPHPDRSVVTDFLEREVTTNTVYDYGEPLQSMEVVWPTGEIFRMGSASVNGYPNSASKGANPSGPGLDFYRFLQGAQGTMGIVTWANLKIESIPKIDKVYFAALDDLDYGIEFLYRILPRRIGQEVLLLNNIDLAAITAQSNPDEFERLAGLLPPWTLILVISGLLRRPEEKVAYEEKFLSEVVKNEFKGIAFTDNLPGFPGLGRKLLPLLRNPWPQDRPYWKHGWQGASQSLFFIAKPEEAQKFVNIVEAVAAEYGYPMDEIGAYVQPIEHNRACQIEFTFFYDPGDAGETALVAALYLAAAQALMDDGALFTRPYGPLAPMIYERTAGYTATLKRVKKVFDPKNILNPGNLCF